MIIFDYRGGGGVKNATNHDYVICERSLMDPSEYDVIKEEVPLEDELKNVDFHVHHYNEFIKKMQKGKKRKK